MDLFTHDVASIMPVAMQKKRNFLLIMITKNDAAVVSAKAV